MERAAILGAGEMGASLARRLAETARFERVVLIDVDEGKARGKALDLLQSGPIEGYDTRVLGAGGLAAAEGADVLIVADPPELPAGSPGLLPPTSFVAEVVRAVGAGLLLVAVADGAPLVTAAVRAGLPRHRVLGSAPIAAASALRRRLAQLLDARAREVALTVLGLPLQGLILPRGSATVGGVPVERLSPVAERRAVETLRRQRLGPVVLAAAAHQALLALLGSGEAIVPAFAALEGEYGHRHLALAVPARLGGGRVMGVVEVPLDPVDRTAFDTLAARALADAFA
jgi:malate dehydrogenase